MFRNALKGDSDHRLLLLINRLLLGAGCRVLTLPQAGSFAKNSPQGYFFTLGPVLGAGKKVLVAGCLLLVVRFYETGGTDMYHKLSAY